MSSVANVLLSDKLIPATGVTVAFTSISTAIELLFTTSIFSLVDEYFIELSSGLVVLKNNEPVSKAAPLYLSAAEPLANPSGSAI